MCVCVCACVRACVRACVCVCVLYIFVFAVYVLVLYMCAQMKVWSCLVTDNFGLFTEIAVCKFLRGWWSYGLKPFYFVHCMCLYIFLFLFVRRIVPWIWLGIMHHRNIYYYYYCYYYYSHKRCFTTFYRFTPFYFICTLLPLLC